MVVALYILDGAQCLLGISALYVCRTAKIK